MRGNRASGGGPLLPSAWLLLNWLGSEALFWEGFRGFADPGSLRRFAGKHDKSSPSHSNQSIRPTTSSSKASTGRRSNPARQP